MKKRIFAVFTVSVMFLTGAVFYIQNSKADPLQELTAYNEHIQVGNLQLGMSEEDVFRFFDDRPEKEMCVYGYEFNFVEEGLNLGFRIDDQTLRRITIKNETDMLYGLKTGMSVDEASSIVLEAGFVKDETVKNRFLSEDVYLTLVSKQGVQIDQLIIEIIDEQVLEYAQ